MMQHIDREEQTALTSYFVKMNLEVPILHKQMMSLTGQEESVHFDMHEQ